MNIMHAFVKIIETTINNKKFFGIKFIKKKSFEELLNQDENVILKWYNAVKPYCIMMKFRLYFDTKKVLGSGNYAKVLLVERQSDHQQFAVKVFSKKDFMKEELEKRSIKYEIQMLRSTCHPRVMRMYELYEGETFVYCLCDLFEGIDLLNAIIKKGPQSELKALSIVFQILESLAYLHSMGIMHRDIKPENIIFKSTNDSIDIGIVDLGFATYEADYKKLFLSRWSIWATSKPFVKLVEACSSRRQSYVIPWST
jgi:serine/threonine protein kinase